MALHEETGRQPGGPDSLAARPVEPGSIPGGSIGEREP